MGKSIRSKREKRLRSLRRKIAEPFYDAKNERKQGILEAIVAAPSQYTLHVATRAREAAMAKLERAALADEAKQSGEPGDDAAQEGGPEGGEAMCVEEEAAGDKAGGPEAGAEAGLRRSSRQGVKGPHRRGAQFKKKVKVSKKVQKKLQRNAEFPV